MRSKPSLSASINPALIDLQIGVPDKFCRLLETFVKDQATRSTSTAGEESIQSIVELLLSEAPKVVAEMCLVVDGNKSYGHGRFGFVDIFLPPESASANTNSIASVLELKNFHLEGLVKGLKGPSVSNPTFKEMEDLAERLNKASFDRQ